MKKACLALALHPFSVSTNSDGAPDKKCSNSHHRFSASTESDGAPAKNAQIRYIHLRYRLIPMVHLSEMFRFTTSIYVFSHIRWSICSEMLKNATSICALGQIRWTPRIYPDKSDGAPAVNNIKTSGPSYPGAGSKTSYHL